MSITKFQVPLQPGIPQIFDITLGGVVYELTIQYRNSGEGGWVLDIADVAANLLVAGIPLVTGVNLLEQYKHLGFAGGLYVQTTSDPDSVPTFDNLGVDGLLYWVTSGAEGTSLPSGTATGGAQGAGGGGAQGPPGIPGTPGLSGYLSTPSVVLPADAAGNVLAGGYDVAAGQFKVFSGTADVTASCTFAVTANSAGLTTSISPSGHYAVTDGMGAGRNSASVQYTATYGTTSLSANFVLSKASQGATGPAGSAVPTLVLSNNASTVYAYSNGVIGSVAGLEGYAKVYAGSTDVTASATFSETSTAGITATINTANNVPVNGQPIGYYRVSAIAPGTTVGSVTIQAVYGGITLTQVYSLSVVPAGIETVTSLPNTNLFLGRVVFNSTDGLLYKYNGAAWVKVVNTVDLSGLVVDTQIASISASKLIDQINGTTQILPGSITSPSIAANSISAGQLTLTGAGAALNDDPGMLDPTAWVAFSNSPATFSTVTDGVVGVGVAGNPSAGTRTWMNGAKKIPLDASKVYRVRAWMRNLSGTGGNVATMGVALFDNAGANIVGDGSQWYFAANGVALPGSWTVYSGTFGPGTSRGAAPGNARTMAPLFVLGNGSGTNLQQIQDLRIEEVLPSALIVDGAITAQKIAANSITAAQIQAGTITGNEIAGGTITGNKMVAGTITAAQIASGTITSVQIAAGTITGNLVAANTITAGNIDSRGLTIKDASGNVVFGSGASIDASAYLVASSAWINSNININPNGTLTGAGAGQVTIGGLGYAGALDATRNALTYSSSAPGSPANGDIWVDTSVNPNVARVRVSGAWQAASNYVTNTNQVTDGAGLGTTALWTGVTGTGKPADNATKNVTTYSSSAPGSPTDGDIWVNTGANPPVVNLRTGGAWQAASNLTTNTTQLIDGALLGQTAIWNSISGTGKPANNATKNVITYTTSDPGGTDGDIWVNTSVNPYLVNVRVGGVWQPASTYTTNTNQLIDGANLGLTANWTYVVGAGKPADNATKNSVYIQGSAPGGPTAGDFWYDTTNHQWETFSGGAWNVVSDITATKTAAGIIGQGAFATLSQLTSGNASTYIANAAIGAAQIGSLNANVITSGTVQTSLLNLDGVTVINSGGSLRVGSINASQITAGLINTSLINLDGITLANIGGKLTINGSGVDTPQVAPNAITQQAVVAMGVGGFTSLGSATYVQLSGMSMSFTPSTGNSLRVDCVVTLASTDGNDAYAHLQLRKDGNPVLTTPNNGNRNWMVKGSGTVSFIFTYFDNTGSTTAHTWTIFGAWGGVGSGATAYPTTTMTIVEFKR